MDINCNIVCILIILLISDIVSDGSHPRAGRRADAPGHERDGRGAGAQVPVLGRDEGLRRAAHQSREGLHSYTLYRQSS